LKKKGKEGKSFKSLHCKEGKGSHGEGGGIVTIDLITNKLREKKERKGDTSAMMAMEEKRKDKLRGLERVSAGVPKESRRILLSRGERDAFENKEGRRFTPCLFLHS